MQETMTIKEVEEVIKMKQTYQPKKRQRKKGKIVKGKYDAGHKKNIWEEMKIRVKIHDRKRGRPEDHVYMTF